MKKINFLWTWDNHALTKTLRIMRISIFLMMVGTLQIFAASTYSQTTKVSLDLSEISVEEVLDRIEEKSEFFFLYNEKLIDVERTVDVKVKEKPIHEVLDIVFKGEDVDYHVVDRKIILSPGYMNEQTVQQEGKTIKGKVTDAAGEPLPGVSIIVKGTSIGTISNIDGEFSLKVPANAATIAVSFLGMETQEFALAGRSVFNVVMQDMMEGLDEVVVVGYGTQKKLTMTAAVSQIGSEIFENRATGNAVESLQGSLPGLVVSNSASGGEPGAAPNINIRGFITSGGSGSISDADPLVLVDGIQMSLSDIDPEDIESVSVLKDAAAASIYGSQAAGGAVIVTTKSGKNMKGKIKVSYSNNFSFTKPTTWPESASAIDFAYAINDSRINNNQSAWHDETDLANIMANMENPGSAPTISANNAGTDWAYGTLGIQGTAATNWDDIILKDWASRQKHNVNVSGGDEKLNFYLSAGAYDEGGLLAVGNESFQRYNLDAKISTKANEWLTLELATKLLKSKSDFPTEATSGRTVAWNKSRVLDLISKLKPTLPVVDPIYGSELISHKYYPFWDYQRAQTENNQLVLQPKFVIEPIENLKLTGQFNYRRNNNLQEIIILASEQIKPTGLIDKVSQENTSYSPTMITNEYFSPNIYATYDKSIGNHNFHATVGYQSEENDYRSLGATTDYLVTNNVVSLNASLDDDQLVSEAITHWATQSLFSRFRYNYQEKYLFEFSYRRDGSSRFAPDDRWAGFPSFSAGYNVAKEDFWPLKDWISTAKLRASYGTLGNQNVSNYLYLSNIDLATTSFLFDGATENRALTPGLGSESLTWETVKTTDIGLDVNAFNNKLSTAFSWYRTDIEGMAAQGLDLPAQLGTNAPLTNIGTSRVQGWEIEATWKQKLGDFGYSVRAVLSDYKRTIVEYPNDALSLSQAHYPGKDLGEIWGLQWDGWFMTDDEYDSYAIDQSFIHSDFEAGDTKYKDLNGDNEIDRGDWVVGNTGDFSVIGNTTPRYQFAINLGCNYKNFDFNAFIQGVGKRDVLMSNHIRFRGPASGPFHVNVWQEHLDYFRPEDTTSPLGPNVDAYFPAPYMNGAGRNNRNYRYAVDRYIQNGAYMRLKSIQIGYTIPKHLTSKIKVSKCRIFVSGENLFTVSDMMFFDPEVVTSGVTGSAQSYPLSKMISTGLNVSF
ncbi:MULTISPECIES: TonB-dependent receptor [unclassified Saccharicrinis]|uniref:TonB-dependent receptor n=1 Tax=unclassified Saccharicrinis TaxID=2646859 RepID=UPI003D34F0AE